MRERIVKILADINDEIIGYDGDGLLDDEIIDSFDVINIVAGIEEEFHIEIDASYILGKYFKDVDSIVGMVAEVIEAGSKGRQ